MLTIEGFSFYHELKNRRILNQNYFYKESIYKFLQIINLLEKNKSRIFYFGYLKFFRKKFVFDSFLSGKVCEIEVKSV